MDDYLDSLKAEYGTSDELQGETASQAIASSKWEDYDVVGFDAGDLEVKIGDTISVSSTSVREYKANTVHNNIILTLSLSPYRRV